MFRRMLPLRLGPLGKEVASVSSAEEAMEYLQRARPDVMLLDVVMPGKDGFEFCRELKADVRFQYLSVIMLTALTSQAYDRSLDAGADDYIPKRVDDAVLRIRVNLHLTLQDLRMRDAGHDTVVAPGSVVLVTNSPTLGVQLPAQFQQDGHRVRVLKDLELVLKDLRADDSVLVLDTAVDPDGVAELLARLRADPETAEMPVLLLCSQEELALLPAVEAMVDDVLWKPLNARVSRFRLKILMELAARSRS